VQPPDARFCPQCGSRLVSQAGEAGVDGRESPAAEPTPPPLPARAPRTNDPLEDLELEEAIARIRRREQRRRLAAVAAGVAAAMAVLLGAAWLIATGWQPPRTGRMAGPLSTPREAAAPAPPSTPSQPEPAAREPGTTSEAREAPSSPSEPASGTQPAERPAPADVARAPEPVAPRAAPREEVQMPARVPEPAPRAAAREEVRMPARPEPVAPRAAPREEARTAARVAPRTPEASFPERARPERELPSAMPTRARGGTAREEMRVDIGTEPVADGLTGYTVRLRERDGRPVTDATVSIRGRRPDGGLVEAMLDRGSEPGVYRAIVRVPRELSDPRLRVASANRVQEVPLPDPHR
jgi:hypothetical protein